MPQHAVPVVGIRYQNAICSRESGPRKAYCIAISEAAKLDVSELRTNPESFLFMLIVKPMRSPSAVQNLGTAVIFRVCLAVGGLLVPLGPVSAQASFDCRAASSISDQAICYDPDLSWREAVYVVSYQTSISLGGMIAIEAKRVARQQMRDRRLCGADPDCIQSVLDKARAVLDTNNDSFWSEQDSNHSTAANSESWRELELLSVEKLVSLWFRMNDSCRGGTTQMHIADCNTREEVHKYLTRVRGWCYGREGEAGVDADWHECDAGSTGVSP